MPLSPALDLILRGAPRIGRAAFLAGMAELLGANARVLYTPNGADTTSSVESVAGQTITWDASIAARATPLGNGYAQAFSGSGQYGDVPDAPALSFGNGTVDQPLTFLALVNASDTAAVRTIAAKFATTGSGEYRLTVAAANTLTLFLTDASASVNINRVSTVGINLGAWTLLAATYDGSGGASALNGATLYQNAQVLPSVANNNASYVAMENLGSALEIGSQQTHAAPFAGSMALLAMTQKALTPAEHAQARALCRRFFGVRL